jgi:hypothetical protein
MMLEFATDEFVEDVVTSEDEIREKVARRFGAPGLDEGTEIVGHRLFRGEACVAKPPAAVSSRRFFFIASKISMQVKLRL